MTGCGCGGGGGGDDGGGCGGEMEGSGTIAGRDVLSFLSVFVSRFSGAASDDLFSAGRGPSFIFNLGIFGEAIIS